MPNVETLFNAFTTLLVTIDPPGLAPIFLALTGGMNRAERFSVAIRGTLIGARAVEKDDEVFLISSSGVGMRTPVNKISRQRRDATGVKVLDVGKGSLTAFTIVAKEIEED